MCLSDGMGSGSLACKESEMVIELVEKFLEAGFDVETAVRMMNSAMVMKGQEDLFSTVDISELDLYDLTISMTENADIKHLFEHILFYLQTIRSK